MADDEVVGMRRRTFLKLLGAAGVVAALPAAEILVPPMEVVEAAHASDKLVSGDIAFKVGGEAVWKDGQYSLVGGLWRRVGQLLDFEPHEEYPMIDISSWDNRSTDPRFMRGVTSQRMTMHLVPDQEGLKLARDAFQGHHPSPLRIVIGDRQFTADDFRMMGEEFTMGRPRTFAQQYDLDMMPFMTMKINGTFGSPPLVELI